MTIRMTEAEVARDLHTVLEKVRQGMEVVIEQDTRPRQFLDELKAHVPIHPVTESTAEIIARIGAAQAAKGITLPLADLIIGACALELDYAIGTTNVRDFNRIPGLNIIRL